MGKRAVQKEKTAGLLVVSFGLCLRGRETAKPPGKACSWAWLQGFPEDKAAGPGFSGAAGPWPTSPA